MGTGEYSHTSILYFGNESAICWGCPYLMYLSLMLFYCLSLQNCVAQIPNLNLPDVCTLSAERGKALCREHCQLLEAQAPEVPTGLRDFLKYCGASQAGEYSVHGLLHSTCKV